MKKLQLFALHILAIVESAFVTPFKLNNNNEFAPNGHKTVPQGKMAKILFTAIVADMRNKINGTVFSKNRGGAYARTKVTPVNPQTTFQNQVRGFLTSASQSWRTLTAAQRLSWNSVVSQFGKNDIFGNIRIPSGINLYNTFYINANTIGGTPLTTPPVVTITPTNPDVALVTDSAPQTFDITSGLATVPAGEDWVIRATSNQSAGKQFVKNQYRIIAVLAGGTTLPYAGIADYTAKFGPVIGGQKIGLEVFAIDNTNFVKGPSSTDLVINP